MAVPKRVAVEGSPSYAFSNSGTIAPGAYYRVSLDGSDAWSKYVPFEDAVITNNADEDVYFLPNQESAQRIFVAAGHSKSVSGAAFHSFAVLNNHATTTVSANEIVVELSTPRMDADKEAYAEAKAPPILRLFQFGWLWRGG